MSRRFAKGDRRAMSIAWLTAALIASTAVVACGDSQNNVGQYELHGTCVPPSNVQLSLVYPAPNATAVPNNFNQIVLGSSASGGLATSYGVYILSAGLSWTFYGLNASTGVPLPNATPIFPNPVYQYIGNPGVTFPNGTLQVFLVDTTMDCSPGLLLGSFSVGPTPTPTPAP